MRTATNDEKDFHRTEDKGQRTEDRLQKGPSIFGYSGLGSGY